MDLQRTKTLPSEQVQSDERALIAEEAPLLMDDETSSSDNDTSPTPTSSADERQEPRLGYISAELTEHDELLATTQAQFAVDLAIVDDDLAPSYNSPVPILPVCLRASGHPIVENVQRRQAAEEPSRCRATFTENGSRIDGKFSMRSELSTGTLVVTFEEHPGRLEAQTDDAGERIGEALTSFVLLVLACLGFLLSITALWWAVSLMVSWLWRTS